MKGKLLQKLIAVVLVLCMTATNFIFVATSAVYALSGEATLEGGDIVFEAYFKKDDKKVTQKTAKISEGDNLFISLTLKAGKLEDGKVKIDNANFTIETEKVDNRYINNINTQTNEIALKELNYNDGQDGVIEIKLPIKFQETDKISTSYFDMENNMTLSGRYKKTSEEGKEITSEPLTTRLIWSENDIRVGWNSEIEKIVYFDNKTMVQVKIESNYPAGYFPKETEKVTINAPKVNDITPSYSILADGYKLDESAITDSITDEKISFVNNFKANDQIAWHKGGNTYKVIYVYDGLEKLESAIKLDATVETKLFNRDALTSDKLSAESNIPTGTIASISAKALSTDVYKGYMYANSKETTYSEKYDMEISYKDGATSTLEFAGDKFVTEAGELSTNSKTVYKQLEINKEKLQKLLGNTGRLKISTDESEITIDATSSADEKGNIIVNSDKLNDTHAIKIEVISAQNIGTLELVANKAIKGNADYDKETIKAINKIETLVKSSANYNQAEKTATVATELKETTTQATLTMNNDNILSANRTNDVEFVATLKTGTMDTDLLKEPTIKILLPQEVESVSLTNVSALYAEEELQLSAAEVIEENGVKAIFVKLDGEQINYNNNFVEGIKITVNAKINLNAATTSKNAEIEMKYTNENSAQVEYASKILVSIQAQFGLITKAKIESVFTAADEGTETLYAQVLNNYGKAIENIALIGTMPKAEISADDVRTDLENANIEITYSKDGEKWDKSTEGAKYVKVLVANSKLEDGEKITLAIGMKISTILANFKLAYTYDAEEKVQDLEINEMTSRKYDDPKNGGETPEPVEKELALNMTATCNNAEVKENDELYTGQVVRYNYVIKNNTDNDIEDVKFIANHEGGNVFKETSEEDVNTAAYTEKLTYTYEVEKEESNVEINVGTVKKGQTKGISYQVRIRDDAESLKTDVTLSGKNIEDKKINTQNTVKPAEIKLELTSNRAKEYPISKGVVLPTLLKVTNNTENLMENVLVNISVPEGFKLYSIIDADIVEGKFNIVSQSKELVILNIDQIAAKNSKEYLVSFLMEEETPSSNSIQIVYNSTVNGVTYYSNGLNNTVIREDYSKVEVTQTSNISEETVKTGDNVIYTFKIKNTGNVKDTFSITDKIPEAAVIKKAYYKIDGQEAVNIEGIENNLLVQYIAIEAGSEADVVIETQIDEEKTGKEEITNSATVAGFLLEKEVKSNEITYKLQANKKPQQENPDKPNPEDPNPDKPSPVDPNVPVTPGKVDKKQSISGIAWIDANKNGIREETEKRLSGIIVSLGNVETGKYVTDEAGNKLEVKTNSDGEYKFENISNGKYVVVFKYDNTKYRNTEYQVKNATEKTNSDIITSKLSSENDDVKYGITDTLELNEKSLEYIDAGFIENEIFDLSLNKYVSKVIIQNTSGTTVKEYDKEKLAKLEIDARNLAGSTLLVEYKIAVKNEGEIAGYANEIIDYMPKDLQFNSEMNKDWYISTDGNAHTTALAKELINPGETRTVTLTLVKTMTENNTGLTSNTAEIAKSSNELSIPDKDSKAGNNIKGEDDISTAELLVSVRTGIEFTIGIIVALIALGTTGIIIYTKVRKEASHE